MRISWAYVVYFMFQNLFLALTDANRVPLFIFIFDPNPPIYVNRVQFTAIPQWRALSNQLIQCYGIICSENERIQTRFQTFKEPDSALLTP